VGEFGISHWVIMLAVVLLLFGGRVPQLARSLGHSIVEFNKGMKDLDDHSDDDPKIEDHSDDNRRS
jgi:sec-independent protein translocase protein TatA